MFKGGMAGMMKKAQKMQDNVQQAQAEIKQLTATGTAGGNFCTPLSAKKSFCNTAIFSFLACVSFCAKV
jgi:hypothetical protein